MYYFKSKEFKKVHLDEKKSWVFEKKHQSFLFTGAKPKKFGTFWRQYQIIIGEAGFGVGVSNVKEGAQRPPVHSVLLQIPRSPFVTFCQVTII